ncbi:hypothetical protein ACFW04_012600 [Cataglyphis niger]
MFLAANYAQSRKPENHLCYMQPLWHIDDFSNEPSTSSSRSATLPSKKKCLAFLFYDFETWQDKTLEACAKENNLSVRCRWCGVREFVFCHDLVKQFVAFATRTMKCFKQIICIAHNAKAFDAQFKVYFENYNNLEPKLILSGTKIVVLTVGHMKFSDSVNYMPMRLSDLPKAFGLQNTVDKGIFSHLFNTVENQSYVGPLPDLHYYSSESMTTKERERFLAWHTDMRQKNTVFDFQRGIICYCYTDIDILRKVCMAFRKIFIHRGNVCPFEECTTIVSTCMTVFRKNFLHSNTIRVIPAGGYKKANNHLRKALQCLIRMERELGHSINHAGRAREYRTIDECSFDRDMRDNREMREYLDNHPLMETSPLDPRDAFFGGRTSNIVMRYEVTGTEKIRYVDVCSLTLYLREYEKTEDIVLDKRNIVQNPGLRSMAKLYLNSFWGKFGQRSNLTNTEVVRKQQRFMTLLTSAEHEITDILSVNDEVIYVSWQLRQEAVVSFPLTNVVIAAYTTTQARLTLYSYLERLERRVLYYDTDSCIYVSGDPNEYEPCTGNFLGDMTDELESYGSYIETFVSDGQKFYAYIIRTPDGRTHKSCKAKGITLNYENSQLVNFNSIRNLLSAKETENEKNDKRAETSINLRFKVIQRTAFHELRVTWDETKVSLYY